MERKQEQASEDLEHYRQVLDEDTTLYNVDGALQVVCILALCFEYGILKFFFALIFS